MTGAAKRAGRRAAGAMARAAARLAAATRARRFRDDDRGAITVEFVVWVPILLLWLIGSLAFYDAYRDRGRAVRASNVISDIVTRQTEISDAFVGTLQTLLDDLLPGTPAGKSLRITSIEFKGGKHVIQWSVATKTTMPMKEEDLSKLSFPLMAELDTLILVETFIPYEPILGWTGIAGSTLSLYLPSRPRFTTSIVHVM